jgi:nicotinamide riboside transporter PnuC
VKILGGILMAIGIVVATLTGLCSAYWLVLFLSAGFKGELLVALVGIVGLFPCAGGVGLFYWGRWLLRLARERDEAAWLKEP